MMRTLLLVIGGFAASLTFAAAAELSASDKAAIFKAAGFKAKGSTYMRCVDEAPSYMPGAIALQDMNGDGATEAFVTESSAFCYGGTEQAFVLLSKDSKGAWKTLLEEVGVATVLGTKSTGWFDIEVGGPGMGPFPKFRFNGKEYVLKK